MVIKLRKKYSTQVREMFSNEIKDISILVGKSENKKHIIYYFFIFKITIEKNKNNFSIWDIITKRAQYENFNHNR